jgi:holo-[acyl-carrier protein] synthase
VARWGDRFVRRVFTEAEIADARRGGDFAASLAARFAAKEAAYKAARALVGRPIPLRSIVVSAGRGRPARVALARPSAAAAGLVWWCSLTHGGGLACAVVVAEAPPGGAA